MKNEITEKHREMVMRLGKPGSAIKESLSEWDCNLTHMGGCLMGEAAEIYDAITQNAKGDEILEELGDYAFYLVAVRNIFKIPEWTVQQDASHGPISMTAVDLMRLGGHFWDVIKRAVIYRKHMGVADSKYEGQSLNEVAVDLLRSMEEKFNAIAYHYDFTLEGVLEANWQKLASTDKGRYASGSYSDEQAQDRRDKAKA